jgi:hypothetical protein
LRPDLFAEEPLETEEQEEKIDEPKKKNLK